MARDNLPEQQAFSSRQSGIRQRSSRQSPSDVITYSDSAGHVTETEEGEYDDAWPGRHPSSSRRYATTYTQGNTRYKVHPNQVQHIPPRRSAQPQQTTEDVPVVRQRKGWFRSHPLLWLGLGMLLMFMAWTGLQAFGSWWSIHQDDVTYGRPRTAQYDVVVGHNDSLKHKTHLIAMNLNDRIIIIELPGGDSSKAKIYQGPTLFGPDADLAPVTLSFRDTTGDGLTDMIVNVQGAQFIYLNKDGQFQTPQSH